MQEDRSGLTGVTGWTIGRGISGELEKKKGNVEKTGARSMWRDRSTAGWIQRDAEGDMAQEMLQVQGVSGRARRGGSRGRIAP